MEREYLERKAVGSAWFLLGGYLSSFILQYGTLDFIMTSEGKWRIVDANEVGMWVSLFAFLSLGLTLIPAFVFLAFLHRLRKYEWNSRYKKIDFKDVLFYFAFYQAGIGMANILYVFFPNPLFREGTIGSIVEGIIPQILMLGAALYLFKGRLNEIGFVSPRKWNLLIPFVLIFFLFNFTWLDEFVTYPLADWLNLEVNSWREDKISEEVLKAKNAGFFTGLFDVIMIGLFVPIAEETMFRGVLQTKLAQKFGHLAGILLTSFLFAFIHIDIVYFAPIFIMALMLGWLRYYFNSVWAAILFHGLNNTVSILIYYFQ